MAELKNNSIIDCNKIFEKKSSDVSEQSLLDEINNVLGDAEIFNDFDRKIIVTNEGLLFNTDSTGRFILISMMISCWIGLLTILALQSLLTIHIFFPLFLLFLLFFSISGYFIFKVINGMKNKLNIKIKKLFERVQNNKEKANMIIQLDSLIEIQKDNESKEVSNSVITEIKALLINRLKIALVKNDIYEIKKIFNEIPDVKVKIDELNSLKEIEYILSEKGIKTDSTYASNLTEELKDKLKGIL